MQSHTKPFELRKRIHGKRCFIHGITFCFFILFISQTFQVAKMIPKRQTIYFDEIQQPQLSFSPILWTRQQSALPVHQLFHPHNKSFAVQVPPEVEFLEEYMIWHDEMRSKFPDSDLLTNPNAPDVSIYYNCGIGGAHDRFFSIDAALYHSFVHKKILLVYWYGTEKLDQFVVPNMINWTVPTHFHNLTFSRDTPCRDYDKKTYKRAPEIVSDDGKVVLRTPFNYANFGYTNDTLSYAWYALFRPSHLLQAELNDLTRQLGLIPARYHVAHCRIRHPAHLGYAFARNPEDHDGANYTGEQRSLGIATAIRAIQCADRISHDDSNNDLPIYFYSDADQLVDSVIRRSTPLDALEAELHNVSLASRVVARTNTIPIAHIGDMKHGPIESYMATFVDLYIAASSRCLAMGVGNFAYLSARISRTACVARHADLPQSTQMKWGMKKFANMKSCSI